MHAGFVHGRPESNTQHAIDPECTNTQAIAAEQEQQNPACHCECRPIQTGGIGDRDNDDRKQVVHDGKGTEKNLETNGDAAAKQGQYAERKGDIGRHRDAPPILASVAEIEREIDRGREDRASNRGGDGEHGGGRSAELTNGHFAFDFEADYKKEDSHESIVDPGMERFGEVDVWRAEREGVMPEVDIAGVPGRICPDQSEQGCAEQENTAEDLGMDKFPKRGAF